MQDNSFCRQYTLFAGNMKILNVSVWQYELGNYNDNLPEHGKVFCLNLCYSILNLSPRSIAPLLPYILPVISERFPLERIQQNSTNLNVEEVPGGLSFIIRGNLGSF